MAIRGGMLWVCEESAEVATGALNGKQLGKQ